MFTGIVKELGRVSGLNRHGAACRLKVSSENIFDEAEIGGSVSVNGVCLTVVGKDKRVLSFDVMEETLRRSALSDIKGGDAVNLELALKANGSLDGHFVLGHVDCVGRVKAVKKGSEYAIEIAIPEEYLHLVVEKGSVAIEGVSLTVGRIRGNSFEVYIIPHTLKQTTLGGKSIGHALNVEFDVIGKYAAKLAGPTKENVITEDFLKGKGFI